MYAVITRADIDTKRPDEAAAMLTGTVVPATKAAAGFSSGHWMRSEDHSQGFSVVLFESHEARSRRGAYPGRRSSPARRYVS